MSMSLDRVLAAVDAARAEAIALTQALVQVPSVNTGVMPTGNETPAARVLADALATAGIDSEILESAPDRGNLIAKLPGSGARPGLLLMGHLDVVPVEDAAQWRHEPFSGEVDEGRIWGRGASDMKATVAAEAIAMMVLKRLGVSLAGDLILAAGADEESGGAYGFGWLAEHHPEKLRAGFAVNEGGGHPLKRDGRLTYPIDVGEKGRLEVRIMVTGKGYHASAPWMARNAILLARPVLDRIEAYEPEVRADPGIFGYLGPAVGSAEPITTANVEATIASMWERDRQLASWMRAASRMTIAPSMIRAGVKSNSIAESCLITCDVRTLPWQDEAYVARQLDHILDGIADARYEITTTAVPSASTYDSPLATAIQRATKAAVGREDLEFFPGLTTGFTDSRLVRPLGITAYGFAPAHPHSDRSKDGAHNIDESTAIDDLMTNARAFAALAWDLLREA